MPAFWNRLRAGSQVFTQQSNQMLGAGEKKTTRLYLIRPDVFVAGDGTAVTIKEISTRIRMRSVDAADRIAMVEFEPV